MTGNNVLLEPSGERYQPACLRLTPLPRWFLPGETLAPTVPAQRNSQTLSLSPSWDSAGLSLAFEAFLI